MHEDLNGDICEAGTMHSMINIVLTQRGLAKKYQFREYYCVQSPRQAILFIALVHIVWKHSGRLFEPHFYLDYSVSQLRLRKEVDASLL